MDVDNIDTAVTEDGEERPLVGGRYRVVRKLGQGGMGEVYLAEDTQLDGKLFALKMVPSILVANKRAYRQLKDEALMAMKLSHTNIVTLRAFEENNGNPFLVMDYVEGKSLDDCLADWGTLTPAETAKLLKPVAAALDYAHSQGVVHRDVKPGNVMVSKDGTPYILDFGIAREVQETLTRVTGKMSSGTLLYMGPEQLNGDAPKPAQDVYSFAAMAYECIKGEPPFSRGNVEYQIMNKPPEPLAAAQPQYAPVVAGIMAGLEKTPEKRPATCAAVLEGAEPPGAATRPPQRHTTPPPPVDFKPASSLAPIILAAVIAVGLAVAGAVFLFGKKKARTTEVWATNVTSFVPASPAKSAKVEETNKKVEPEPAPKAAPAEPAPAAVDPADVTPAPAPAPDPNALPEYVVKENEDVWAVAIKFSLSPAVVRELNGLKGVSLTPGQRIKLPAGTVVSE